MIMIDNDTDNDIDKNKKSLLEYVINGPLDILSLWCFLAQVQGEDFNLNKEIDIRNDTFSTL